MYTRYSLLISLLFIPSLGFSQTVYQGSEDVLRFLGRPGECERHVRAYVRKRGLTLAGCYIERVEIEKFPGIEVDLATVSIQCPDRDAVEESSFCSDSKMWFSWDAQSRIQGK